METKEKNFEQDKVKQAADGMLIVADVLIPNWF